MLQCFAHVAEKSQLFMSVQSDLYDIMSDGFEYKEQVTTCDPYDCKVPLCLTEHSSLAITRSPPNTFAALLMHRSTNAAGSWAEWRGRPPLLLDLSSTPLLPNPLPLGASHWCCWTAELGQAAEDSLCLPAQWPGRPSLPCVRKRSPCGGDPSFSLRGPGKMYRLLYTNKDCEF